MSPVGGEVYTEADSFPRVSGDEPVTDAATDFIRWFSPRERG